MSCSVRDTRRLWRHGSGTPRYCFRVGNKSNGFGANPASPRARQHPPSAGAAPPLLSTARAQPVPTSCAHRAGPSGPPSPASRPDGGLDEIDACGGGGEAGSPAACSRVDSDWGGATVGAGQAAGFGRRCSARRSLSGGCGDSDWGSDSLEVAAPQRSLA